MDIRPTAPGLVALQAVGDNWTIGQIVDSIDGMDGWEIASEITSAHGDIAEQITVLLRKTFETVTA